jgi:hypothetical protein
MKRLQAIIVVMFLLLFTKNAIGLVYPPTDHLKDPTPDRGEEDVDLSNPKGVLTCINVTVDSGCTVNLTFQWWNTSLGVWGGWQIYGYLEDVAVSGQYCFWNINVSCATENFWTEWFHWRVVANFTCQQTDYQEIFYTFFNPEDCPLFYIYPPWNETDICPCCDAMCVGINNVNGNDMNITFYRNDTQNQTFYIVNRYINVPNGTYCFCLDGHIDDIYYPMKFNETYHWYVNVTDTVTGDHNISEVFGFTTAVNVSDCLCGNVSETSVSEKNWTPLIVPGLFALILVFYLLIDRRKNK